MDPDPKMRPPASRAGRPRKNEERASARERLLEAAHAVMSERSSIDVSVQEIATRAELNVALINYYFGGKDGLLLELAVVHQSRYEAILQHLLASPQSAEMKLMAHIRGMVRAFRRVPYLQRLHHKILRDSSAEAAIAVGARLVRPLGEFYRELIEQGVADGTLRRTDPMHVYLTIVGACDMLYSGSASLRFGFDVDQVDDAISEAYADYLAKAVLRGLGPPA